MKKVPFKVSTSQFHDETTALCDLLIPNLHALERWDDARPSAGEQRRHVRLLDEAAADLDAHEAVTAALVAWEGLTRRGAPIISLATAAAVYYAIYKAGWTDDVAARNAIYLLATVPVGLWLAARLYLPSRARRRPSIRAWPHPARRVPAS